MKCHICGASLSEGAVFCYQCGSQPGTTGQVQSVGEVHGQEYVNWSMDNSGKSHNIGKYVRLVLTILFSVLAVTLGIGSGLIYQVRNATNEKAILELVNEVDLASLKIGFLIDGESKRTTLSEYIVSGTNGMFMMMGDMREKDIEKLLEEEFIKEFLADKANDYMQDIFNDTGDGIIESKEIAKVMRKNTDVIEEYIEWNLRDEEIDYVEYMLDELEIEDVTDLSELRDDNPKTFRLLQKLTSKRLLSVLLVFVVVSLGCILLIQDKKVKACKYIGINFLIIGVANIVIGGATDLWSSKVNNMVPLGKEFWELVFAPFKTEGWKIGGMVAGVGILLCLVYLGMNLVRKKRK